MSEPVSGVDHDAARSTPEDPVVVEVADGVGTVRFARPQALNALDRASRALLLDALAELGADPEVRCVVLRGTGRAFCVGQDLREHAEDLGSGDASRLGANVTDSYNPIALTLAQLEKPVLAGVNGIAAGAGASIAFLADYRLVAASAGFTTSFTAIGLSADTGSSWTLPRLVGRGRALDLLLNPRTVPAEEALAIGLASEVVPDADFDIRLAELATRWAHGPTLAYAAVRKAVAYGETHPLSDALPFEARLMELTGASDDHRRAVEAFLAKQPPTFTGR